MIALHAVPQAGRRTEVTDRQTDGRMGSTDQHIVVWGDRAHSNHTAVRAKNSGQLSQALIMKSSGGGMLHSGSQNKF
jgi:hypothetical protein